jgi:hypothetical protein
MPSAQSAIEALLKEAPEDVRAAIAKIFRIEQEHLYMSRPQGVPGQIVDAIEDVVK